MKELTYVMVKPDYANNTKVINMVKKRISDAGVLLAAIENV